MMSNQNGQSILEVVFSIGLISLVTGGVAMLVSATLQNKSREVDKRKMVEMSEMVMENVVNEKINNAISFWDNNSAFWQTYGTSRTLPSDNYRFFVYSANITQDTRTGCSSSTWECATVVVNVGDSRNGDIQTFNRFFSKR